jgi:hypothetical protein
LVKALFLYHNSGQLYFVPVGIEGIDGMKIMMIEKAERKRKGLLVVGCSVYP